MWTENELGIISLALHLIRSIRLLKVSVKLTSSVVNGDICVCEWRPIVMLQQSRLTICNLKEERDSAVSASTLLPFDVLDLCLCTE